MIRWVKSTVAARAAGLRADPTYEWALATGFKYYGNAPWLPVLIELKKGTAQSFALHVAQERLHSADPSLWPAHIRVPSFYETPPDRLLNKHHQLTFLAVIVTKQFLADLYAGRSPADWIKRFELGHPTPTLEAKAPAPSEPDPPITFASTPSVVTGVIDDGIAFGHDRFWSSVRKTRIECFWDQLVPDTQMSGQWNYGREFTKRASMVGIDDRMQLSAIAGLVDEDELYRRSGFFDQTQTGHKPLAARFTHGTHVTDLVCNDYSTGPSALAERPIVAVQLPVATVDDTSGATLTPQVFNGLCYIIAKAQSIASAAGVADLPVVANVSYGLVAGPHDGSSLLEDAIDDLIDGCTPPVRVVLPAGNNFLSRCHARCSIDPGQRKEIAWRVLPDDWTESHVEIWLPLGTDTTKITVTVVAPEGTPSGALVAGAAQDVYSGTEKVGRAEYHPAGAVGHRALLRLSLAPTSRPDDDVPTAPAGLWQITIDNSLGATQLCDIDAWIQRDDAAPGYARSGRQSYFDDPDYQRYDDGGRAIDFDNAASWVKRAGTLNGIATGEQTIVVGGFRRSDNKPATYSAAGPLQYPGYAGRGGLSPDGPEALFPSEDAPSLRGVLGAGTRSNSCTAMVGTSVSAPYAARFVVEQPSSKGLSDRDAVFSAAGTKGPAPSPSDQPRFGGGRIDMPSTRPLRREP